MRTAKQYRDNIRRMCLETMDHYWGLRRSDYPTPENWFFNDNDCHAVISDAARIINLLSIGRVDVTQLEEALTKRAYIPWLRARDDEIMEILSTFEPLLELFAVTMEFRPFMVLGTARERGIWGQPIANGGVIAAYSEFQWKLEKYATVDDGQVERIDAVLGGIPVGDVVTEPLIYLTLRG